MKTTLVVLEPLGGGKTFFAGSTVMGGTAKMREFPVGLKQIWVDVFFEAFRTLEKV